MKSYLLTFIVFLLTASCAYSQNGLPRLTLQGSDTVAEISLSQLRAVNRLKVAYDECQELSIAYQQMNTINDSLLDAKEALNANLAEQLSVADRRFANAEKTISDLSLQQSRKESRLKFEISVLLGLVAGLTTYILVK